MAEAKQGGWGTKATGGTPSPFVLKVIDAAFELSRDKAGNLVMWNSGTPINLNLEGPTVRVTLTDDGEVDEFGEAYNVPDGYEHPRKSYLLGDSGSWNIKDDGNVVSKGDDSNSATRAVGGLVESMLDAFQGDIDALGDWSDPETWIGLELTMVPTLVLKSNGQPIKDKNDRDVYNDIIRVARVAAKELTKELQKAIRTIVEDEDSLKAGLKALRSSDIDISDVDADELKAFVKKVI